MKASLRSGLFLILSILCGMTAAAESLLDAWSKKEIDNRELLHAVSQRSAAQKITEKPTLLQGSGWALCAAAPSPQFLNQQASNPHAGGFIQVYVQGANANAFAA